MDTITYAFSKIRQYADSAAEAYPASPNILLIQEISALMQTRDVQMSDLKRITCED